MGTDEIPIVEIPIVEIPLEIISVTTNEIEMVKPVTPETVSYKRDYINSQIASVLEMKAKCIADKDIELEALYKILSAMDLA